jgi:uncharacterized protein (DUF927 family)
MRSNGSDYFIKPNEEGNVNFIGDLVNGLGEITSRDRALVIKINNNETVSFEEGETKLQKTIKYVSEDVIMEYRGSDMGYDLYITAH